MVKAHHAPIEVIAEMSRADVAGESRGGRQSGRVITQPVRAP